MAWYFLFGGHASPDVPLGLVHRQHVLHVPVEAAVQVFQPLGDILVHRALADAELLCRPAHGGLVFHNVLAELRCPVVDDAAFHKAPLASNVLDMYESDAFVSTGAECLRCQFAAECLRCQVAPMAARSARAHQEISARARRRRVKAYLRHPPRLAMKTWHCWRKNQCL